MDGQEKDFTSSALQVNLKRTAAQVEIPERQRSLLRVAEAHYGVHKRTRELLVELNHPFVNWDYVLTQLKTLSIGDFYDFNEHPDGYAALATILEIYLDIVRSGLSEDIRGKALRYLFDFLDTVITSSKANFARNRPLLSAPPAALLALPDADDAVIKKAPPT
jgi:pyruvate,orthophosphate dikinase